MKCLLIAAVLLADAFTVKQEPLCKTDTDCRKILSPECDQKIVVCKCKTTWCSLYRPCDIKKGENSNIDCLAGQTCGLDTGDNNYKCVAAVDKGVNWILTPSPRKQNRGRQN
ncbi:unnamed protein product, partial [Mesorhabditis spiculigera]